MYLLKLVEKYPIIENKITDGATTKDKQLAWQNLAAEYNSQTNLCPRTSENLMSRYKNQKIEVKKMHSNEKMAIKGGGLPPQPPHNSDPVYDKIKTLIGPSLEGLNIIYDGDAKFMQEQNASTSIDTPLKPIELTLNIEKSLPQLGDLSLLTGLVEDTLDDLPLDQWHNVWYQHDGAPPHIVRPVLERLTEMFGDQWIGRRTSRMASTIA
ncbi:unnamed protein product [Diatraea saccharalis]|uniref:Regulatory protein zeste n=1 Tax=Diatraea saccharalis TaxID=40085 RepID=A0A9N9R598_9NEOP|nr:unnamed protein product [Diatraea saccharalis]